MMWEDNVNRDLKVVKINHCKKQAKGRNGWKQITEQVNEDLQCVVECLDLIPVKGKTGGDKMLSEWVTCKYQLPWGKKRCNSIIL
jgi:hypothetical protein